MKKRLFTRKKSIRDRSYTFLGVLSSLIALIALVTLVRLKSRADNANQLVDTGNAAPVVDSLIVSDVSGSGDISGTGFTPNEAAPRPIYARGVVSDANGCSNLDFIDVVFYRSGVGSSCGADGNNCYQAHAASTTFTGCAGAGDNNASFEVSAPIKNYADPTDAGSLYEAQAWKAYARITDQAGATGTTASGPATYEMNSLAAFNLYVSTTPPLLAGTVDFGTLALGATSTEQPLFFDNTGNRAVSSTVYADGDMVSSLPGYAVIPSVNTHYASSTGFIYASGTAIQNGSGSATPFDVYVPKQTADTSSTVPGYFILKMPAAGVNGTYTNTLTLTAVP